MGNENGFNSSGNELGILIEYLQATSDADLTKYGGYGYGLPDLTEGSTLDWVISSLKERGRKHEIVEHPRETTTIDERAQLISQHPEIYQKYGDIEIVQNSILSYKNKDGKENILIYFHDGKEKIKFNKLKKGLGITKKIDLTFYKGSLKVLLGIDRGKCSPFIPITEVIQGMYFDESMIMQARENPNKVYDLAISTNKSLFANIADVYSALCLHPTIGERAKLI